MSQWMKKIRLSALAAALLTLALGIVLIAAPGETTITLCRITGIVLLVTGVFTAISYWIGRQGGPGAFSLVAGLVEIALGLFVTLSPASVVTYVAILLGVWLIIHGIVDVQYAAQAHRFGAAHWWVIALAAAVTIALGVLVLVNPFGSISMLTMVLGVSLAADGVKELIVIFWLNRAEKQFGIVETTAVQAEDNP